MKKVCLIISGIIFITQASFAQNELPPKFTDGLNRAKMVFSMPEGFTETEIIDNSHMKYEYAIKHNSEKFEIRYAIRPMDELLLEYEKKQMKVDPNKVLASIPLAVVYNISGTRPKISVFDTNAVNKDFNADKGSTVIVEVREGFSNGYKHCLMVSIFKKNLGTAFYFYMADNPEIFIKMVLDKNIFQSLKFEKEDSDS